MLLVCISLLILYMIYKALSYTSYKDDAPIIILCLTIPFLMFWWMDPAPALLGINMRPFLEAFTLDCKDLAGVSLSNDYGKFTTIPQVHAFFSLKNGSFPLFFPWFWYGQSVTANTLSQIWHPFAFILPHFDMYGQGGALKLTSVFQLVSLGMSQSLLYMLLRKLASNRFLAFIFSFIAIYNIRMLESFRYQASLEAYTGMMFTCVAIGFFYLSFSRQNRFWYGLLITFSTYWLVTSGHPQFMFYGLLASFAFLFLFPWLAGFMMSDPPQKAIIKFYCYALCYIFLGVILASVYTVPYYFEFLQDNSARARAAYEDLNVGTYAFWLWLCNFLSPLDTDIVANGSFGASPAYLYALILSFFVCILNYKNKTLLFWYGGCLLFCAGIFLLAVGSATPVHRWFCEHLPFFGMLRYPARIAVVLPLFLSLLGWSLVARANDIVRHRNLIRAIGILIVALVVLSPFIGESPLGYAPSRVSLGGRTRPLGLVTTIHKMNVNHIFYGLYIISAIQFGLIFSKSPFSKTKLLKVLTCVVTVAACGILMMQCNWIWHPTPTPTYSRLLTRYSQGQGLGKLGAKLESEPVTLHNTYGHTFDKNFASIYWSANVVPSVEAYYTTIPKDHKNLVLIGAPNPTRTGNDEITPAHALVKVVYFTFNRFTVSVTTDLPGWMKINYAYNKRWHAYENGKAIPVYRANGAEMAVPIKAGTSSIEFYYDKTFFLAGISISCATLLLILLICIRNTHFLRKRPRISFLCYILAICFCTYILYTYDNSIYKGENIPYSFSRAYPEDPNG